MKKFYLLAVLFTAGLNAQTVIYSQSNTNTNSQIVTNALPNGTYVASADDFKLTSQSTISKIKVEGKQTDNTLETTVATGALIYIYADNNGKPAGIPNVATTTAPIAMVDIAKGAPGYSLTKSGATYIFEIDLTLASPANPIVLQPNTTYWLVFVAKTNLTSLNSGGDRFTWSSGQINHNKTQIIDPSNALGLGLTQWTTVTSISPLFPQEIDGFAFSIEGTSVLGTHEVYSSIKPIAISPNPTSDYLYIKSKSKINQVTVFDISGRKLNADFDGEKVDVRNLQAGNYIINIEAENGKTTEKFIKK